MRGRRSFSTIFQEGERRRHGDVVVIVAPGQPGPPQVGFVAGRKVGNAVRRNRAKRRLRAAVERVPLAEDTAYVVIGGPQVPDIDFERLMDWVTAVMGGGSGE
ncbi:MAG: ribonuclease P protein component [Acidimicrobiia bacterium]|nr:ribonuclease P protein component [Acidimicrobiia bacterium]